MHRHLRGLSSYIVHKLQSVYQYWLLEGQILEKTRGSRQSQFKRDMGLEAASRIPPAIGLGTFRCTGESCKVCIRAAIECGIRHIDTASVYKVCAFFLWLNCLQAHDETHLFT